MLAALIALGCIMTGRNGLLLTACLSFTVGLGVAVVIVGALGWTLLASNAWRYA